MNLVTSAKDRAPDLTKTDKPTPKKSGSAGKFASFKVIQDGLQSSLVGTGTAIYAFDQHCGGVLIERGPLVAAALTEAAKQNPTLKVILARFVAGSTMAQVVGALSTIVIPIASHHGLIPRRAASLVGGSLEELDLEPGGSRNADRPNKSRKDHSGQGDSAEAAVLTGDSHQAQGPSPQDLP